jgi:hypothetical protein
MSAAPGAFLIIAAKDLPVLFSLASISVTSWASRAKLANTEHGAVEAIPPLLPGPASGERAILGGSPRSPREPPFFDFDTLERSARSTIGAVSVASVSDYGEDSIQTVTKGSRAAPLVRNRMSLPGRRTAAHLRPICASDTSLRQPGHCRIA